MAAFDYVAVDAAGRTVSGALSAADEGAARQALDRRRLLALEITPTRRTVHKADGKAKAGGRLNAKTLALTTAELFQSPDSVAAAKIEFERRRGPDFEYRALLGDRAPALNYRD